MRCAGCGQEVAAWSSFVLCVELFAAPEAPSFSEEDLARDRRPELDELIDRLRAMGEAEIAAEEARVHERRVFRLCATCRERWHLALSGIPRPVI
ncbi:MAG: hypothetical protein GYA21_04795 [Myxococcales bacterium]|nr:hypothetical protein [Myxococcales bacterium]